MGFHRWQLFQDVSPMLEPSGMGMYSHEVGLPGGRCSLRSGLEIFATDFTDGGDGSSGRAGSTFTGVIKAQSRHRQQDGLQFCQQARAFFNASASLLVGALP